ncbi:sodium/calcium exchanger NCL1-like isoform X2 [Quercus lobata]|uniref:sodium/calcium exchanger NCL1-like isoform X2 n=1 Tax=Quercus lobata TaxID=97700 RepID=UPI00124448D7|nr:sodium/calcium exchanger NCL1-like isoform X2 [Quercus lobata]XP_030949586.1 sodium/calcium exchanger NCL1-like isoform X2 [Quercus lobata]
MANKSKHHLTVSIFLFLVILSGPTYARFIALRSTSDLLSDGVHLTLNRFAAETSTCDETYGFLPCTTSVLGNIFLIAVYGFLMFIAAKSLSDGSELLLEILGPGIIGGLFLPILGALPDAMLILVSGLSGSTETAQSQVSVGMGLLAGSTVMLLTIIWGSCVIVGKCDLKDSVAQDAQDTKGFSLTESGISTDIWTSYAAMMMVISVIPFLVVQIPQLLNSTSGRHLAVLIGLIVSLLLLVSYCAYQVLQPSIQQRKIYYVKQKRVILGFLWHLKKRAMGKLLKENGEPDEGIIEKWLKKTVQAAARNPGSETKIFEDFLIFEETKREQDLLDVRNHSEEVVEGVESSKWTTIRAALLLLLGTIIAAAFADPLVDAVDNFSDATGIPAFFISFIALPLATNSSEAVTAIIFASRDKRTTASLTFSELYGAATMNNVLCLSVFLALVYIRGLTWDFSAEVLVILIVCLVMGLLGSLRTHFPLWTAILAILLYPFSLALVYVLDYVLGWS